jgi:SAM-dependent methyltransferase
VGKGMEAILSIPSIEIIESDVSFGPRTALICDAHDIPFDDNSFDGVIVQAVLEHVLDPNRCVEEIHRVLKENGAVYAETPFMQQVHMGRYDFTRFTHLGHRRLFRKFEEVSSGPVCGPGMALSWSYEYFFLSFVKTKGAKDLVKGFTRLTSFWLKYFDYFLIDKPGTFDAASGYYFIGTKSDSILSDRELLKLYKGIQ